MHRQARDWVARATRGTRPRSILELGSYDSNGSVRHLFPRSRYWGVDIRPGKGVDEVADAATWKPRDSFDLVLCLEVFEHTSGWPRIISTAAAAMEPLGAAVFTMATEPRGMHSALDGKHVRAGEWYANIDASDLVAELERWFGRWTVERADRPADLRVLAGMPKCT